MLTALPPKHKECLSGNMSALPLSDLDPADSEVVYQLTGRIPNIHGTQTDTISHWYARSGH